MIWFTADSHWGHFKIIRYAKRPFQTTHEHDEQLVENWNRCVSQEDDVVYHLGDVIFARNTGDYGILDRLNGSVVFLVQGNHDKGIERARDKFGWIKDYFRLKIHDEDANFGTQDVVLFHYPILSWDKKHYRSTCLHAHCHSSLDAWVAEHLPHDRLFDVGVDAVAARLAAENGTERLPEYYRPVSYDEVKKWASTKKFKPIDHHEPNE
jgi:calcineurin-like phosphoesterase family protein